MAHRNSRGRSDLSFLELVSHGRKGTPGRHDRLLPGQIEQIARTVRNTPEVMVKISGGGQSAKAVAAHFKYIGRQEFEIETDGGERLKGKAAAKALVDDWELELDAVESRSAYRGRSGRKPAKLVHNIVLSMPAGALSAGVLEASRAFAREQFGLKHRYALALHTDEAHPHVHLVVKAMSEQGKRMNIRKETLREWRRQFASHLRANGIAANATERAVRGVTRPQKPDGIYRAMREGRSSHLRGRLQSVAAGLRSGKVHIEAAKGQMDETRREVLWRWSRVRDVLRAEGQDGLADEVGRFIGAMPPPRTEREWLTIAIVERVREPRQRQPSAQTR